ncbi:MAG TPA: Re/Si-specific NAD(P)(+) transhydrogenase subunit alpha [Ferrovibrio sp.]|uniref:Re/Si-specific NAD(P)(+) transhydrogenase subunit alpha n=1 Tax=Ferrovibrio sp. TaxID=1917215 RepID=UPI002B4AD88A|nr:Re/Si-specific NAD(P)(+) transhydrogenase subunit alpha [Ferrovibrio sp.]HLT77887.1 Re/Si-specific NAD(P)(+) transhydrogenase subunit alpha [Ferrovibrio sp.]
MKIGIPKERRPGEKRVAASPETVKKFAGLGCSVVVETGAGLQADIPDDQYTAAGAAIAPDAAATLRDADLVLKVQRPMTAAEGNDELALLKKGAVLVAGLQALQQRDQVKAYAEAGITAFAMELMPRITRAQSMDILSSQSNLAGYKSVLDAAQHFGRAFPMMMTSAGTIAPARVFVMGVGVAGLQAIATAKRLGAVVSATDVRPATKEQVESLGGKFIWVDDEEARASQTAGGYAKEMSDEYKRKQAALIAETVKKQDIIITTALIPGRPAPVLVTEEMVKSMRPGSVIVDLAVEAGGNCPLSKVDQVVEVNGVKIVGYSNYPSRVPVDASNLFAKNLWNFLSPHWDKESKSFRFNFEDETVSGTCVARDGAVVHPMLKEGA